MLVHQRVLGKLHHFDHPNAQPGSGIRRFGAWRHRLWVYGFLDLKGLGGAAERLELLDGSPTLPRKKDS